MVIGVSGKYCSGKNTVADILENRGWKVLDADKLGHEALVHEKTRITEAFSESILGENGEIDRKKLGKIVFSDKKALEKLESIVHPWMYEQCRIFSLKHDRAVINAAVIYKMGVYKLCSTVIWVTASLPARIGRALKRDALPLVQVIKRIWAQRKLKPKYLPDDVDIYIIRNDRRGDLPSRIDSFLKR